MGAGEGACGRARRVEGGWKTSSRSASLMGWTRARHHPLSHAQVNYRTMTGCVVDYGGTAFVVQPWPFTLIFCVAPDEVCCSLNQKGSCMGLSDGESAGHARAALPLHSVVLSDVRTVPSQIPSGTDTDEGDADEDGEEYEDRSPFIRAITDTVVRIEAVYAPAPS